MTTNFYSTMYLSLTTRNATERRTDRQLMGCVEPLLSSREYVGECRVTLLLLLSAIEFSSPSTSFEVVSAYLYTEFVLISCIGQVVSAKLNGLMILAGVPETF